MVTPQLSGSLMPDSFDGCVYSALELTYCFLLVSAIGQSRLDVVERPKVKWLV